MPPNDIRSKVESRGHFYWDGTLEWPKNRTLRKNQFTTATYYPVGHYVRYGREEDEGNRIIVRFVHYDPGTGRVTKTEDLTFLIWQNYYRPAGTYHSVTVSDDAEIEEMNFDKDDQPLPE